jgi:hypothetical protein
MMMMNIYSGNLVQYRKKYNNENYKDYIKLNLSLRLNTFVVNSKNT